MFGKVKRALRAAIPNSVCSVSYKCVPQNDWGRLEEALTSPTQCELGKCMTLFVQIYEIPKAEASQNRLQLYFRTSIQYSILGASLVAQQ